MKDNENELIAEVKTLFAADEKIIDHNSFPSGGKRSKKRFYLNIHTNKQDLFVKYAPLEESDVFKKEFDALNLIKQSKFVVPKPIKLIQNGIIMSQVNGSPLESLINKSGLKNNFNLLMKEMFCIASFHKSNKMHKQIDAVDVINDITGNTDGSKIYGQLGKISLGSTHGDLDPFNTLFNSKSEEFGLIDWEDLCLKSIQGLDALHFTIMLGVIVNPGVSWEELYQRIFNDHTNNLYVELLKIYSQEMETNILDILKLIPIYCDSQNYRLIVAGRSTRNFLYTDFKKTYYEKQR